MSSERMRRREVITLLGGAATWPLAARAQQSGTRSIGVLFPVVDDSQTRSRISAFRDSLLKLGWTEGRNLGIEYRFASGGPEDISRASAELISLSPDVIVASGSQVVAVLQRQTRSIPIVFAQVADPVGQGFVRSLA